MKKIQVLSENQLEMVAGGTDKTKGYRVGFKKVHKAIFWADSPKSNEGYFENKFKQVSDGFGSAGSTSAEVGIVATDAAIVGTLTAAGLIAFTSAGAGVAATISHYVTKAKNKIVG